MKSRQFLIFALFFSLISLSEYGFQALSERPGTKEIENELFDLINRERAKQGLSLLQISKSLIPLARRHSKDMAERSDLTHISSDGKTYAERLKEAGLFFKGTGENVAFSQSFLPETIHNSFMRSKGHRENILDPRFDKIGIGVHLRKDEGYYITQDFLTSLEAKSEREFREMLEKQINYRRSQRGLAAIPLLDELNQLAHDFSKKRAQGEPLPHLPDGYGEILYLLISTPLLEIEEKDMETIIDPLTTRAGIGIYFNREEKNPGGTYFISFILLRNNDSTRMNPEDMSLRIAEEINAHMAEKGERPVKLDQVLSDEARVIAEKIKTQGGRTLILPPELTNYQVIPYNTNNPLVVPTTLKVKLNYIRIRKIGIGIVPDNKGKKPSENYWVVILFY
ncbi:MAG: CAP domain-containing protein [Candidatus Aminicenantes bacterium]|jgi:hypothetical protein